MLAVKIKKPFECPTQTVLQHLEMELIHGIRYYMVVSSNNTRLATKSMGSLLFEINNIISYKYVIVILW